jgi:hypothetical protein
MTTLAIRRAEPIRFSRPKLPKIKLDFSDVLKMVRWSNRWPRIDEDEMEPEYVRVLWWQARIP